MRRQNGVVWLDDRSGDLRSWIDRELQLALLTIVDRQTLHEKSSESGSGAATERVEDQETLQSGAVVGNMTDLVEHLVDEFFAHCVMTSSVIVGGIFLARDHLLWMEQFPISSGPDFIDHIRLQIDVDRPRHIFALSRLGEEGAEARVGISGLSLFGEESIRLNPVLQAVQLPAGIGDLNTGLADCRGENDNQPSVTSNKQILRSSISPSQQMQRTVQADDFSHDELRSSGSLTGVERWIPLDATGDDRDGAVKFIGAMTEDGG